MTCKTGQFFDVVLIYELLIFRIEHFSLKKVHCAGQGSTSLYATNVGKQMPA